VDLMAIVKASVWAALLATALGVMYTAPARFLVPTFLCGFAGRCVRDASMAWSISQDWATLIASAAVVVLAVAIIPRHTTSPVVLICGVLPLGASGQMLNMVLAVMELSSSKGDALTTAAVALSANVGKGFTTSIAIAGGLAAGIAIVRPFRREAIGDGSSDFPAGGPS